MTLPLEFVTHPAILGRIREYALATGMSRDSCIACSCIMVMVLEKLGYSAELMPVRTELRNPIMVNWLRTKGVPQDDAGWQALADAGGRFLVLGETDRPEPAQPGKWPGHLVAIVEAEEGLRLLIDLSLDQADRPAKQIRVKAPALVPIPAQEWEHWRRGGPAGLRAFRDDGVAISYEARPENTGYLESPDYRLRQERFGRTHVDVIIDGMTNLL